jgi:methylthioribose-1-phosphate isomerase
VSHQVIADAAVAWLFERQPVDLVVVAAETIAANGDAATLVGGRAIADLAAAARGRDAVPAPRLVVIATGSTIDAARSGAGALPDERRPVRELGSYLASAATPGTDLLNPAVDVIPADRIDVLVTEAGRLRAPTADAVLAAARE